MPQVSERKLHLTSGLLIGFGIAVVAFAVANWFAYGFWIDRLSSIFRDVGINPDQAWLIRDWRDDEFMSMILVILGAFSIAFGVVYEYFGQRKKVT